MPSEALPRLKTDQIAPQARQKAAQEAGQKIRFEVESFVADCVASLREETAQLCEDMLSSINGSETEFARKPLIVWSVSSTSSSP